MQPSNVVQGPKKSYAHTAQLLRTLEQVAVALRQKEAILLVGETGTGKSTLVQQLADQVYHENSLCQ